MALVTRAQDLQPEQLGAFTAVMLGSAFVGMVLEVPALVLGVRAAVHAWRRRGSGFREVVGSGPVPQALALVGATRRGARRVPWFVWILPLAMYLSVVFLAAETPRYRAAIDPFIVLLAAIAVTQRTAGRRRTPS